MNPDDIKKIFEDIYEHESDSLFRYTLFRVSSRAQALDIVQDVFSRFWQSLNNGVEIKNPRAFLFTLLKNRIVDHYRKKKSLSLDMIIENTSESQTFQIVDMQATNVLVFSSEIREIIDSINTLNPDYRECIYLKVVEDLSPEEIAKRLGITKNLVCVRVNRGLKKVRDKLKIQEDL